MDWSDYIRFASVLIFVLALIGLLAWVARRFGLVARVTPEAARGRLAVVEGRAIDAKRRLVLLRRDSVEHLVMLGMSQDLVIERAIPSSDAAPARPVPTRSEDRP